MILDAPAGVGRSGALRAAPGVTGLEEAHRRLIARRISVFAAAWLPTALLWVLVLGVTTGTVLPGLVTVAGQVIVLVVVAAACRRDPGGPSVRPLAIIACVAIGASSTWLFIVTRGHSEVLAFVILTLFLASALLFAWGWIAELVVIAVTLGIAVPAMTILGAVIPAADFVAAVLIGSAVSLAIAEGTAHAFALAFHHRHREEERTRELEVSRDAYRDLAENARDFIYSADPEGRITYVNEALAAFLGVPVGAIIGGDIRGFEAPHVDNPDFDTVLARMDAGESIPPLTFATRTSHGVRWVEVLPSAIRDARGRLVGVRGIGRDVTERRHAELALRESEERFRSAFDSASIGMVVVGPDGRAREVNAAFCAMVGYAPGELVGASFEQVTHPADVAATAEHASAALAGGPQSYHLEKRYRHKRGHTVWGLLSSALVRDAAGAPLYFISQIQDITERKHAEEALRQSEERYRELVESQSDLISRFDVDGRYTFVNDAYCRAFGLAREDLLGRSFADFVHPDDLAATRATIAAAERPPYRGTVENRQRTARGWRWIAWDGVVLTDEHGRPIGVQSVGRDITERRVAEEALRSSLEELRHSEERLRLLAQRQARIREEERKRLGFDLHDNVCQELIGIAILIESLRRRLSPIPETAAGEFDRLARYLHELVEHLRLLARDLRPMPLRDLGLEGSLRSLAEGMATRGTRVSAQFPTSIPRLDEEIELAVYRIAQEALTNAVRHAHAQTIVLTLAVGDGDASPDTLPSASSLPSSSPPSSTLPSTGAPPKTGACLRLLVRDDGRGFDPDDLARSQALGLVSMRERAVALGGELHVTSTPGMGTTIRLVCPLVSRVAA